MIAIGIIGLILLFCILSSCVSIYTDIKELYALILKNQIEIIRVLKNK